MQWDAWDVDIFFEDKMWKSDPASSVNVIEAGPLRVTLEVRRRILHSDYVQRISLTYNSLASTSIRRLTGASAISCLK